MFVLRTPIMSMGLIDIIHSDFELSVSRSLEYGRANEDKARQKYIEVTGNEVHPCGLVVHPVQSWLGASPDGIAVTPNYGHVRALEIKCPYSCASKPEIEIDYLQEGQLKKSSSVYTQIQVQLYCCNLQFADLMVYSKHDYKLIEVRRDEDFL